jgi:hypothetical protein
MFLFHSYTAACFAHILHGRQLILAHVFGIYLRRTAKTAIFRIAARITQMPGRIRHRAAIFTGISHINIPPFLNSQTTWNKINIFHEPAILPVVILIMLFCWYFSVKMPYYMSNTEKPVVKKWPNIKKAESD